MNTEQCTEIKNNLTPLRQGDILYFNENQDDEKYGIVVTGDCDIAQHKCRGKISYCTITTAKYYIETELLFDYCISQGINELKENVLTRVCKLLKAKQSNSFLSTLLGLEEEYLKTQINDNELVKKIMLLKEMWNKTRFSLDDYKNIYFANNNCDLEEGKLQKVKDKILSKLNSLPGDKYYITELPNQNDNFGYVVHLRYINLISEEDIKKQNHLYRIGHLEAPYLYKLTQKLGAVFSDIGEPEKFEKNRTELNYILITEL